MGPSFTFNGLWGVKVSNHIKFNQNLCKICKDQIFNKKIPEKKCIVQHKSNLNLNQRGHTLMSGKNSFHNVNIYIRFIKSVK